MLLLLFAAVAIAPPTPEVVYQQPQLTATSKHVALAFGAKDTIYVATSSDGGASFGTPAELNAGGKLALGRHRGPRVAYAGGTLVVSAIVGEKGRGQDGDLLAWKSSDGGRTWSKPVHISDVPAAAREGLHAMEAGGGVVVAAWLDLRATGTRIYAARSTDAGATWSKNTLVYESPDGTVCQCCHPSIAISKTGEVYVMFRNALGGSRDLYVAKSADKGRTFQAATKLGSGTWPLNACPMDGGAIALDRSGRLTSVWRRDKDVFAAADDRSEKKLGTGKDAAAALGRNGLVAAWSTADGIELSEAGAPPRLVGPGGKFVHLTATPGGDVLAAWEQDGGIRVLSTAAPQR